MKKLLLLNCVVAVAPVILLTSCYTGGGAVDPYYVSIDRQRENVYYVPAAVNAPLLTEKGDISFDVMRGSGSNFSGIEVQAACLPAKHVGLLANYTSGAHDGGTYRNYTTYNQFELGGGYITKFRKGWHFETYAGWGTGNVSNQHYTGSSSIRANHFFVQPSIAVSNAAQSVQFAFISKLSGVNFNVENAYFDRDREQFSANQIKSLDDKPFHMMWEPGLVFRAGWKYIMFNAQYSYSADLTSSDLHREKNNFSIGILLKYNVINN